jgi:electron transport complex protein RnfA
MAELVLIIIAAALVNNFVLVQFLGLCPFMGASRRLEGAVGLGLATGLVLTTASGLSYLVDHWLLIPNELEYLRLIAFIWS